MSEGRNRPAVPAGILEEKTELRVRKLADKSQGERVRRYNPDTDSKELWNPATEAFEPWPLLGVTVEAAPDTHEFPMKWVLQAEAEGWLETEGARDVVVWADPSGTPHRAPGGGPQPYVFRELDRIVIKAVEGEVAYRVIRQPGQHLEPIHAAEESEVEIQYRIDAFYLAEKEG